MMKQMMQKSWVSYLMLVVWLFHATLPFIITSPAHATARQASESSSFSDIKVPICTADGYIWVSWDDIASGQQPLPDPSHTECGLCYYAAHGMEHHAALASITLAKPDAYRYVTAAMIAETYDAAWLLIDGHHNRAPPQTL